MAQFVRRLEVIVYRKEHRGQLGGLTTPIKGKWPWVSHVLLKF